MPIRVALVTIAAVAGIASTASAGMPRLIKEPVFACPVAADTAAVAKLYADDPAEAGKLAKRKHCDVLPPGLRVSMTDVNIDLKTACVVPFGETRCLWIPTGKTVSAD